MLSDTRRFHKPDTKFCTVSHFHLLGKRFSAKGRPFSQTATIDGSKTDTLRQTATGFLSGYFYFPPVFAVEIMA
jgi:hypothetical protein